MATEAQRRAKEKYEKKTYFKTLVRFPKDQEEEIRKAAADAGKSLNEYIVSSVLDKK